MCALMMVLSKNPVHSVLYLIITMFTLAGHFVLLNAHFLAAVHVIVYSGAILVLFLYIIMMLNLNKETEPHKRNLLRFAAVITAGLLLLVLVASLKGSEQMVVERGGDISSMGLVRTLGDTLFNEYLLPFEITSILLLSAMVGAVMLGKSQAIQK